MTDAGLNIDEWMVAWNPLPPIEGDKEPGAVKVGLWPDKTGWSDGYECTTGCCWVGRAKAQLWKKRALMFRDFRDLVIDSGIDPRAAHREFMKIAEYRRLTDDIRPMDEL